MYLERYVYDWQKAIKTHKYTPAEEISPKRTTITNINMDNDFALQMKISPKFVIDHRSVIIGFCVFYFLLLCVQELY